MKRLARIAAVPALVGIVIASGWAEEVTVNCTNALRLAISRAKPGTTILIAPGNFSGGLHFRDVSGNAKARITIKGADPKDPPVFKRGSQAMHFADCNHITFADFTVDGCTTNGLNCDDGGSIPTSMHHLIVENVTIQHIGPRGNHDGLKMSGVDQFIIRNCRFIGWGGSGIDMVGCHKGVGDDVAALIAYVQSDSHSLHDRNLAVWALGQAKDERALPVLQTFVTGETCDHSKYLCQYELKKAVELSGKDPINILKIRTPVASNHCMPPILRSHSFQNE